MVINRNLLGYLAWTLEVGCGVMQVCALCIVRAVFLFIRFEVALATQVVRREEGE